jgi:hypothetical protein
MDHLIRQLLLPFASFAAGVVVSIVFAAFMFGASGEVLKWCGIVGGFIFAIPSVISLFAPFFSKRR